MLAVIENHQNAAAAERLDCTPARIKAQHRFVHADGAADRAGDRAPDLIGRGRREFDDDGSRMPPRGLEREGRLASATRAEDRHDAGVRELCADRVKFGPAADE